MSLRAFHVVFIIASVLVAVFLAAWAIGQYRLEPSAGYLATAGGSLASAVVLVWYGRGFQRRTRGMS
jgi:hypothetical protein